LRPGDGATVVDVDGTDPRRAAVLASLGLLPGVAVTVVQRWPAWVVRLGFAEVALDTELARQVRVERRV
jgi:Fe2+ transport system protein FeoA